MWLVCLCLSYCDSESVLCLWCVCSHPCLGVNSRILHYYSAQYYTCMQVRILKSQLTNRFTIENNYKTGFGELFARMHSRITRRLEASLQDTLRRMSTTALIKKYTHTRARSHSHVMHTCICFFWFHAHSHT